MDRRRGWFVATLEHCGLVTAQASHTLLADRGHSKRREWCVAIDRESVHSISWQLFQMERPWNQRLAARAIDLKSPSNREVVGKSSRAASPQYNANASVHP
jgi:hypothetical protein